MTKESAPNGLEKKTLDLYTNPLTRQDVEIVVEKSLGPNYKIHNYHVKSYSNENLGYMGAHRNLVIEVSKEDSSVKEPHTYFLKSIPYHISEQAKACEESKMFYKETNFFNLIMPELMKSSKDKSWAPQCYLVKDDALVFENLTIQNYVLRGKFLDVTSLKAALSSLAKLHAASLITEKRLGKTFIEMCPELMKEIQFSHDGWFDEWCKAGFETLVNVANYLGLDGKIASKMCHLIYEKILPSKTRRNVVNHGDAWVNNLMYNGSKCALVDFQLLRYAPTMNDVSLLLYHNAKKELRDKYEKELLEHYHMVLADALKDSDVGVPSFEDVADEYEEARIVGLVTTNMYYQINKIDKDKQAELMQTSDGYNDLLFRNRINLVLEMMAKDEIYKEIVSSALRELVDLAPKYLMYS